MWSHKASVHERTPFIRDNDVAIRRKNAKRVRSVFPGRIPVILSPHPDYNPTSDVDPSWISPFTREKFIVPVDQSFGQFAAAARYRYGRRDRPTSALLFCVWSPERGWTTPPMSTLMCTLDERFRSTVDGLLYVYYCEENTFGSA